jgi:DNA-binding transcriptional MerR regulator
MDGEPRYNIRAVERLTGVPAPTLRSWERRYGFPLPARSSTARRLYSDHDVHAIRWVRAQTEHGLSVAQAIEWVQAGGDARAVAIASTMAPSPDSLIEAQLEAVHRYDEGAVESALTQAFAHYPSDYVLLQVVMPVLVQVGDLWERGDLPVAAEHFYSNVIRRRLLSLLAAQPAITPRMTAALACLPGEQHELGLVMLALFLRWSGAAVLYFGADLPVHDLVHLAETHRIDAICLSAGGEADLGALATLTAALAPLPRSPCLYLGGAASRTRPVPDDVTVLDLPLPEAAAVIVARTERSSR